MRYPRVDTAIRAGIDRGWHTGMQLYVSQQSQGETTEWGDADSGTPMTSSTLLPWLSAGKPITAVCVMRCIERGDFSLQTPIQHLIPEFSEAEITIQDCLTHTADLKPVVTGWPQTPWNEIIHRVCHTSRVARETPQRAAYDPVKTWFLLGEIIRRVDGRPIEKVVREDIFEPLGMHDSWMAIPADRYAEIAPHLGAVYALKEGQLTITHGSSREIVSAPSPGSSCRGPASDLGRFYEMLLGGGVRATGGPRILQPETVAQMTSRHREGLFDATFQHRIDFGLGLILDSNRYGRETVPYGFGRHCSPRTFGHGGAQSSIGFCDPAYDLVVVLIANGCPGEVPHNRRFREILSALYDDLGLVTVA